MKRFLLLVPILCVLAACHDRRVAPAAGPSPDLVRARAEKSFDAMAKSTSTAVGESVPSPLLKVVGKDPALGCTWVEVEVTLPVSETMSKAQARAAAVERARVEAMRNLLGVELSNRSLTYQQESLRGQETLIENMLRATRRGCILKEDILADEYRDLGSCKQCAFYARLRPCIKERAPNSDKDFSVEVSLNRDNLVEGDEARLSVTSTRDVYLYVYDVGMNSETSLIAPNEIYPQIQVRAGQTWEYPDEAAAKRGVHLVAQMPEGKPPVSAEVVRVVATKIPLPAKLYDPADGGYLGLMRRLNASPYEWVEDAAAFTIYPLKGK